MSRPSFGGRQSGKEVIPGASYVFCSQLWVCGYQYHCKRNFLALYSRLQHRSWTSTWFLSIAYNMRIHMILVSEQTTDHSMVSSGNAYHDPQHSFWHSTGHKQHGIQSTWKRHQYGSWWQSAPKTSMSLQRAIQTTNIYPAFRDNMTPAGSLVYGHQHCFSQYTCFLCGIPLPLPQSCEFPIGQKLCFLFHC